VKILIIGGSRHGEWVETLDGTKVWLDITNATQHRIRAVTNNITDVATGKVTEAYTIQVAVHADLLGPYEAQQVSAALNTIAMNAFYRAHGDAQEIPQEPAGADLIVPEGR
jgi:hypothetical protein